MIESILSFNFSDKKIFPDTKEGYIYISLRYFGRKESWANALSRYCDIDIEKKWEERRGLHAIRETPSILDRRKMARCDEKARGEETAANCRGSSIVAKFAPRFHARYHVFSPSFPRIPSRLSSSRYCDSNQEREKKG